jgi:hypothetical protein
MTRILITAAAGCILTGGALLYLVLQRNFRLAAPYGCFYLLLALLLYCGR